MLPNIESISRCSTAECSPAAFRTGQNGFAAHVLSKLGGHMSRAIHANHHVLFGRSHHAHPLPNGWSWRLHAHRLCQLSRMSGSRQSDFDYSSPWPTLYFPRDAFPHLAAVMRIHYERVQFQGTE